MGTRKIIAWRSGCSPQMSSAKFGRARGRVATEQSCRARLAPPSCAKVAVDEGRVDHHFQRQLLGEAVKPLALDGCPGLRCARRAASHCATRCSKGTSGSPNAAWRMKPMMLAAMS